MSTLKRVILIAVSTLLILMVPLGRSLMFTVDEREVAVVLQFGEPVQSYTKPGLKFKLPFVQEVRKLPKTLQFWSGAGREVLEDLPTADGKRISETKLDYPPVFDGMAVANGSVFISDLNGNVVCLAAAGSD